MQNVLLKCPTIQNNTIQNLFIKLEIQNSITLAIQGRRGQMVATLDSMPIFRVGLRDVIEAEPTCILMSSIVHTF